MRKRTQEEIDIISAKRKATCLLKYGHVSASGAKEVKDKVKATCLLKYGSKTTLQLDKVKTSRLQRVTSPEINLKRSQTYKNKSEEVMTDIARKREETNLKRFGVKNTAHLSDFKDKVIKSSQRRFGTIWSSASKEIRDKVKATCLLRLGTEFCSQNEEVKSKVRATCLKKFNSSHYLSSKQRREHGEKYEGWTSLSEQSDFQIYQNEVWKVTRKHIDSLYEHWDGKDYYTGKLLNLIHKNKIDSPSIDHKISCFYGFKNNINPHIVGDISNLCICSKRTNSKKNYKTEEEFKRVIKTKKISNWEVEGPNGFVSFDGVGATRDLPLMKLSLGDNELQCSPYHIVFNQSGQIFCKDLIAGDLIKTKNGDVRVTDIISSDIFEPLYDLLNVNGKSYFTNDVLSHNCFLGSSKTLIKSQTLESLESWNPIAEEFSGNMRIWEQPIPKRIYSVGMDVAKGTGGDYSICQVLDITQIPFVQVATYRNNMIDTRAFAKVAHKIAVRYNDAYICIENNDIGQATCDWLWHDAEYENLVNYKAASTGELDSKTREIGIRATKRTKHQATDTLKIMLEDNRLVVKDSDTIYELSKFVETKPGVYGADDGENDDCVTSLYWALWIIKADILEDTDYITEDLKMKPERDEDGDELDSTDSTSEMPVMPVMEGFGFV